MFSIVIPVYNVLRQQLEECIESVLGQTYHNYELILVDDCSTWDEVRDVLRKYEKRDRVKVIYRKENGHISECTNTGINATKGDYIVFSDCDDVLSEHALYEMAVAINKDPELDFIYSDEDKLSEDGTKRHMPFFQAGLVSRYVYVINVHKPFWSISSRHSKTSWRTSHTI